MHVLGVCICASLPQSHFSGEANMKRDLCFWRAAPASPRSPWLWSTVLPTAGPRDVTGRGADEPWGTMPCSCTDVPTRVQGWKRPISSPCPWLSGQWKISPCTVHFLCFVQSKLSQSIEFLSLPHVFILQETGAGLYFLALSLGLTV